MDVHAVRETTVDFLKSQLWDDFLTITYRRERRDTTYALNDAWRTLHNQCGVVKAFLVSERYTLGLGVHLHGIIEYSPLYKALDAHRRRTWATLFNDYGRTQVAPLVNYGGVSAYCAKYLTKDRGQDYNFYGARRWWVRPP